MRSANTLRRSGWTPELFPEGEQITITGSPDRDDPFSCYVSTVIFPNGSSIDRYGQITAPDDIGQGARPERLANGEPNISGDWAQEQVVMTDPRGQVGTLVPLSEVDEVRATGDFEARGTIGGARGTEQAALRAEAARLVREGEYETAEEAEAALRAAQAEGGPGGGFGGGGPPRGFGGFGGNALTEAGQAAMAAREPADRFAMSCVFTSVASEWGGEPINRVVQRGDTISILYGRLGVERTVQMGMDSHPDNIEPTQTGHSIGHWEDDVLVVDTVGFAEGLFSTRMPHSEELHLVERFRFDPETQQLRREYTATDPLFWNDEQTGSNAMDISDVAYHPEVCEDLTVDPDAPVGQRG